MYDGTTHYFDWPMFNSKLLNYQRVSMVKCQTFWKIDWNMNGKVLLEIMIMEYQLYIGIDPICMINFIGKTPLVMVI